MSFFNRKQKKDKKHSLITISSNGSDSKADFSKLNSPQAFTDSSSISPDERPYYQPDSYYTFYSYPGTYMATRVIPFDERKIHTFPSKRGLYVAEIMLLEYCRQGDYPKPRSGYPGFWWFKYGIRDIGHALESLEKRGFIEWAPKTDCLNTLKVDELKQILTNASLPTKGKKSDLIERIASEVPEQSLDFPNYTPKYRLTNLGAIELEDNGYIPYMHNHRHLTTEDDRFGETFTVWDINKLFPDGDSTNWKKVLGDVEEKRFGVNMVNANPINVSEKSDSSNDISSKRRVIIDYLSANQATIKKGIKSAGDGYEEESQGIDLKSIGRDKEALVKFYISIGKGFDAPALYKETAIILRKYKMYDEELAVLNKGLEVVQESNWHREELLKRKEKVEELIKRK